MARRSKIESGLVHISAIIAAGGRGTRFGAAGPKQLLTLSGEPILKRSVDAFLSCDIVSDITVALPGELAASPPAYLRRAGDRLRIVAGGARRQDSVARAFASVREVADIVVVHDAARPLVSCDLIRRTVAAAAETGAATAALPATDTVKRRGTGRLIAATLPRDEIYLAQTPQAFRVDILGAALALGVDATDEAMLAERAGYPVQLVDGDRRNLKITTAEDLTLAEQLLGTVAAPMLRIGNGYDLHRLVAGRPLILGGVTIPFDKGLQGHSDADVICHAVTDAILGAANAGDIGRHFPDTDPQWKGANSIELLRAAAAIVRGAGFAVANVDVVVIAQRPKLSPYAEAIKEQVAGALGCAPSQVSVKGKTNEGVDSTGAGESIAAHAVALLNGVGPSWRTAPEGQ
jgi:2-C-methyl-D-erythritol 4-phosphate cytidylyltransferase/2-C-methyl-D-erythritol 2,4-cyclodiphosphate synthase